jgi:hypothetical protein
MMASATSAPVATARHRGCAAFWSQLQLVAWLLWRLDETYELEGDVWAPL